MPPPTEGERKACGAGRLVVILHRGEHDARIEGVRRAQSGIPQSESLLSLYPSTEERAAAPAAGEHTYMNWIRGYRDMLSLPGAGSCSALLRFTSVLSAASKQRTERRLSTSTCTHTHTHIVHIHIHAIPGSPPRFAPTISDDNSFFCFCPLLEPTVTQARHAVSHTGTGAEVQPHSQESLLPLNRSSEWSHR